MEFSNISADINQKHLPEYLITNGLGSYVSSTILNLNTRKYHGFVAKLEKNYVILSGIDECIEINGKLYELSTHHYKENCNPNKKDIFFPGGFKFFKKFEYSFFPKFYYEVDGIEIEKEIFMPYYINAVVIHYKIKKENAKFFLYPLMAIRDYHTNLHIDEKEFVCEVADEKVVVSRNKIKVYLISNAKFLKKEYILRNVFYQREWERGYDAFEDLYCPGYFFGNNEATIIVSLDENLKINYEKYKQDEIFRIENLRNSCEKDEILRDLSILADKFIIKNPDGYGIIAGYHWFGEWGRDTMISIPGLCLTTKRYEIAKSIIKRWLNFMHDGLIPNFINCSFSYNSSDASLWLFNATYCYYISTNDIKFIEEIYIKLCEIVEGYVKGNDACKMDHDCLIISNPQTTWMDTKWTKREGKAVEINALWFNALSIFKFFSKLLNKQFEYEEILKNVKENFEIFWNSEKECLYDVINDKFDEAIRPNQIFAISLPFSVIDNEKAKKIFNVVFNELLTPYGLRTLSKNDKNYKGTYEGDMESRDKAYHNGTVWPFLIGSFIDAHIKINKNKKEVMKFLIPILEYFEKFNTLPEIFDGDFPYTPRGCIAQAWSVAEVLRVWSLLKR